jgi:tagatose 1,6-diphosphate aldolase
MRTLTLGIRRGLQQCSTRRGALSVLAVDHRQSLRRLLHPKAPGATTHAELTAFKRLVVSALAPSATAVLLDPEFGAPQCILTGDVPGSVGLVVAGEATGYAGEPTARQTRIQPGWSVHDGKQIGASAVKLLVYYHPDAPTALNTELLVRQFADECGTEQIPFFLEAVSYSLHEGHKTLGGDERRRVVLETARRLTPLGVDVLKAEFPLDATDEPDEREWERACVELSQASVAPWILLSASARYNIFLHQVRIACEAGASGVAVGRAVWQEAAAMVGTERREFLDGCARERMAEISQLCEALARPWQDFYAAPKEDRDE